MGLVSRHVLAAFSRCITIHLSPVDLSAMPANYPKQIRRNSKPFETDNHKHAAQELEEFWEEDPEMTWREMGNRGDFSRTYYSQIYSAYFQPVDGNEQEPVEDTINDGGNITIPNDPLKAFMKGYQKGRSE